MLVSDIFYGATEETNVALGLELVEGFQVGMAIEYDLCLSPNIIQSSQRIQFKRGLDANLPASLEPGEPAYTTDTKRLFIGDGSGLREFQGLSANGYLLITKNAAPADAELQPGQAALWFDPTNGSSGLKIKAKELDGSVVTASFSTA